MNTHTKTKIAEVSKTYNMIEVAKALNYNYEVYLPLPLCCILYT